MGYAIERTSTHSDKVFCRIATIKGADAETLYASNVGLSN